MDSPIPIHCILYGGANDFLTGGSPIQAAQNIAGYVSTLAQAGAAHFFVPNLPDLSLTSIARERGLELPAQMFSIGFNNELAKQLSDVRSMFPTSDIIQFDIFSLFNESVQNSAAFGFTDAQNPCVTSFSITPCANPGSHIFWDDLHPTTQAHAVIAAEARAVIGTTFDNAIPEPGMIILLVTGLFALTVISRPDD